ncbi:hypothetical protein ASF49_09790 [Methylobacterium sp. Leaf104]|uniref:hypothetical protein n=1 Tax=Methylobacterium TaxID=407 RepID=UPI0006FFE4C2|nr:MULTISPECIES: hypothetical protein [Methylobacterium]KQP31723.1 hypothetical protein ASF49_09790 [Methylobacterium sp. Leaf104]MCI9880635.1 hypothetical protein [Methylobacterium goesingense]
MPPLRPVLLALALAAPLAAAPLPAEAAPAVAPAIGCPSLANLRLLLRESKDDAAAAAGLLADDKADHLGCATIPRDAVAGIAEHLTLNGNAYDCLTLRTTSVCHWVVAGTAKPVEAGPRPRGGDKARASDKAAPSDKAPQPEKARR